MKVGARVKSQVCDAEFVIVRGGPEDAVLTCGGVPVGTDKPAEPAAAVPGHDAGSQIGKRYVGDAGLEVLCTKSGFGALAVDGVLLTLREAKKLPASD